MNACIDWCLRSEPNRHPDKGQRGLEFSVERLGASIIVHEGTAFVPT